MTTLRAVEETLKTTVIQNMHVQAAQHTTSKKQHNTLQIRSSTTHKNNKKQHTTPHLHAATHGQLARPGAASAARKTPATHAPSARASVCQTAPRSHTPLQKWQGRACGRPLARHPPHAQWYSCAQVPQMVLQSTHCLQNQYPPVAIIFGTTINSQSTVHTNWPLYLQQLKHLQTQSIADKLAVTFVHWLQRTDWPARPAK